jgi:riboflavin synthase
VFTGLIQTQGSLQWLGDRQLQITYAGSPLANVAIGDSIAVNGVCLTVEVLFPQGFVVATSPETRQRTALGHLPAATVVNLEAALQVGSKLGGHFVTGHVDGVGTLESVTNTDNAWELSFTAPLPIARYIIPKGSIAVNGVSLTVASCNLDGTWFKVAVIPHTFVNTTLQHLQPGSPVNLEGDLLGKYVEKFLRLGNPEQPDTRVPLTADFLTEHGYL